MAKQTDGGKKKSESEVRAETEARADQLFGMALRNLNKNALASVKKPKASAKAKK
jgi:hypothetical protein